MNGKLHEPAAVEQKTPADEKISAMAMKLESRSRSTHGLETLRNLGPVSAAWLRQAGVSSISELQQLGPVIAFRRVRQCQPMASLNLLWSLAAALADKDLQDLTATERMQLREELRKSG